MTEEGKPPAGVPRLVLIASVSAETDSLRRRLDDMRAVAIGRKPAWSGLLAGREILLVECGMGKTNAAQALTATLERVAASAVLNFGVGGAYPESGLKVGDVALASAEWYADEGVAVAGGWLTPREMGIPLVRDAAGELFDEIPVDAKLTRAAAAALSDAGIAHREGPFATVSACSGTAQRGEELAGRLGALVETMEGAACAHVCRIYEVPFLELRGISNLVEDRNPAGWRIEEAAGAAARAVEQIVACW